MARSQVHASSLAVISCEVATRCASRKLTAQKRPSGRATAHSNSEYAFGLRKTPAAFSRSISSALRELNGQCVFIFVNDILVYSRIQEENFAHLRRLFELITDHKLFAKTEKCLFGEDEVDFLGHKVREAVIATQQRLTDAVRDWPTSLNVQQVRQILVLSGYYREFVWQYAAIAQPLTELMRREEFHWDEP